MLDQSSFKANGLFCIVVCGLWWVFLGAWWCVWIHGCLHTLQQGNMQAEAVATKGSSDS
jgi:hypothetical protein